MEKNKMKAIYLCDPSIDI